jgi:hypothetical protein
LPDKLEVFAARHFEWSLRIFGDGKQTAGLTAHIEKEIAEIRAKPDDLAEWIDVMTLALDGYLRHGGSVDTLLRDLEAKQAVNLARTWPQAAGGEGPVEHDRAGEESG